MNLDDIRKKASKQDANIDNLRQKIQKTDFDNKDKIEKQMMDEIEEGFKNEGKLSIVEKLVLGICRFAYKHGKLISLDHILISMDDSMNNLMRSFGVWKEEKTIKDVDDNDRNKDIFLVIFAVLVGLSLRMIVGFLSHIAS